MNFPLKKKNGYCFCWLRLGYSERSSCGQWLGTQGRRCYYTSSVGLGGRNEIKRKAKKSFLKSQAHHLQPIFQIGKGGLNDQLIVQIGEALEKRELIKVSLLQNTDEEASEVASILEEKLDCQVVQIIGRVLVIFKISNQEKKSKDFCCCKESVVIGGA